jgi:hypothetical protein
MDFNYGISRRAFVASIASVPLFGQDSGNAFPAGDIPRVDLQAHLAGNFTVAQAVALARERGVRLGICATHPDDKTMETLFQDTEGQPVWHGLEVNLNSGWTTALSQTNRSRLDYIMSDGLFFSYNGTDVHVWDSKAGFDDPQDFMEKYVDHNLRVIAQPIQIWCNAAMLPASLVGRSDELWTTQRMDRLIQQCLKSNIAIEINSRWETPKPVFIRRAKDLGAKFSIGTDARNEGIGKIDYSLRVAKDCGLTASNFYLPAREIGK